jgi:inosine-uridine nucleoside N-ribohydrolase
MTAIVLLIVLSGCRPSIPTPAPTEAVIGDFPIGSFANSYVPWTWQFRSDGTYSVGVPSPVENGTFTVSADQIALKGDYCGEITGTYNWAYDGQALTFTVLDDACHERQYITGSGKWVPTPSVPSPTVPYAILPTPSTDTISLIFDDDGSLDGTVALFYLLRHPRIDLKSVGISYGEAHPREYIQHVARALEAFGISDVPLGAGQDQPLSGSNAFPEALRQSSGDFWGLPVPNPDKSYPVQDAAVLMVSTINASPDPVTIFVSGPSTNIAEALRLDPEIREKIAGVYVMGGAVFVPGNIFGLIPESTNVAAEWNIYADPLAAKEVFGSGLDIYLVPLDATNAVTISSRDTSAWRGGGPEADMAADLYDMEMTNWGVQTVPIWDLMTAAIMTNPDLCRFRDLHLDVVTEEGRNTGQTIASQGTPNIYVCLLPDVTSIKQTLANVFSENQ